MKIEKMKHKILNMNNNNQKDGRCLISFYLLNEESIKNMNNKTNQTIFTIKGNYGVTDMAE